MLLAALLLLGGCAMGGGAGNHATGAAVGSVVVGQSLPDLELAGIDGRKERLSDYRGKVVLLDVWASWCEPCKTELPMLNDIAGRLRDRGVEVLAVSVDQDEGNMRTFLKKKGKWRVRFFHDPYGRVPELLQPPKMPTSYVIDREGIVRQVNEGFEPGDARRLEKALAALAGPG